MNSGTAKQDFPLYFSLQHSHRNKVKSFSLGNGFHFRKVSHFYNKNLRAMIMMMMVQVIKK